MPTFTYHSSSFPKSYPTTFRGTNTKTTNWANIVYSAFTVGKRSFLDVRQYGIYSLFEIIYRSGIIFANLMEDSSSRVIKSDAYKSLDFSEKSAISYFLGLTFSKLMADDLLNIPWLMHLDVYSNILNPHIMRGRSRPDLVGEDSAGNWLVMESKGRSNGLPNTLMGKAKIQTGRVRSINGNRNIMRVALAVYFEKGRLNVSWEDPDESELGSYSLELNSSEFINNYYQPIKQLFLTEEFDREPITYLNRQFLTVNLPASDTKIGIETELNTILKQNKYREVAQYLNEMTQSEIPKQLENYYLGKDGILVVCGNSWNSLQMQKEPIFRES